MKCWPFSQRRKKRDELNYWIRLSKQLTESCTTDLEREKALFMVSWEKAFVRYKSDLYLRDDSFAGQRILDVGCGPHCGIIGFRECEKYGVDHLVNDYRRIGYPLHKHGVRYINAKSEKMPFETQFFDVVICVNALDHVDSLHGTISEIARVLKKGGRFIGQFNFHDRPRRTEPLCLKHERLIMIGERCGLKLRRLQFQYNIAEMKEDRYYYEFEKA